MLKNYFDVVARAFAVTLVTLSAQPIFGEEATEDPISVLLDVFPDLAESAKISDGSKGKIQELYLKRAPEAVQSTANLDDLMYEARQREAEIGIDVLENLLGLKSKEKEDVEVEAERVSLESKDQPMIDDVIVSGQEPVIDFSGLGDDFLSDWTLLQISGRFYVERFDDPVTRLEVFPGVILGEYGRVREIVDFGDELYLELQNGEKILGQRR